MATSVVTTNKYTKYDILDGIFFGVRNRSTVPILVEAVNVTGKLTGDLRIMCTRDCWESISLRQLWDWRLYVQVGAFELGASFSTPTSAQFKHAVYVKPGAMRIFYVFHHRPDDAALYTTGLFVCKCARTTACKDDIVSLQRLIGNREMP